MMFKEKRTALITGASRGIGLAIQKEFAAHGVEIVGPSRQELDLLDPTSISAFLKRSRDFKIDILINNAGINFPARIESMDTERWSQALQVNATAPFLLSQHFSKGMCERGWGRIVNLSSIFSLVTKEGRAVYSAAKSALNGLTRTSAVEWGSQGVLVNAICPGYIDTALTRQNNSEADLVKICDQIPLRRLADADEIAKMVVFLSSDMNTYMTGQCVVVDGGFTIK